MSSMGQGSLGRAWWTILVVGGLGWLSASPGALQVDEARSLKEFRTAFRGGEAPGSVQAQRRAAFEGLLGDSKRVTQALLEAVTQLEDEAAVIEVLRARVLFDNPRPEATLQRREVLDPLRELQEHIGWRLAAMEDPRSIQTLVEAAFDDEELPYSLRLDLAPRNSELDAADRVPILARLKRRAVGDACVALWAFLAQAEHDVRATAAIIKQLRHRSPLVRSLAARALALLPNERSVAALVQRLRVEDGPVLRRVFDALAVLTRAPIGHRVDAWYQWWEENRKAVQSGEYALGGGQTLEAARAADRVRYHGIELEGEAVMFVLDCSGSMEVLMRPEEQGDGQSNARIKRAKARLIGALGALPESKRFNIVTFSTGASAYRAHMVKAEKGAVLEAQRWVSALSAEGGTALYDGLDLAFLRGGRPARDEVYELEFDSLFVLMDGLPTRPRMDESRPENSTLRNFEKDSFASILAAVERWNVLDQAVLNVIILGQDFPGADVRELARQHRGALVQEL